MVDVLYSWPKRRDPSPTPFFADGSTKGGYFIGGTYPDGITSRQAIPANSPPEWKRPMLLNDVIKAVRELNDLHERDQIVWPSSEKLAPPSVKGLWPDDAPRYGSKESGIFDRRKTPRAS